MRLEMQNTNWNSETTLCINTKKEITTDNRIEVQKYNAWKEITLKI